MVTEVRKREIKKSKVKKGVFFFDF